MLIEGQIQGFVPPMHRPCLERKKKFLLIGASQNSRGLKETDNSKLPVICNAHK